MRWIQHRTNSRNDPKMRKLIRKHGMRGYGIYWAVNEMIAEELDKNLNCILEADIDDLSEAMNEPQLFIVEVLEYCVEVKLMTKVFDRYQNLKILEYMDEWTRKKLNTPEQLRSNSRHTPDGLQREGREVKEEKRREEKKDSSNITTASEEAELRKANDEFLRLKSKIPQKHPKAFKTTAIIDPLKPLADI